MRFVVFSYDSQYDDKKRDQERGHEEWDSLHFVSALWSLVVESIIIPL